MRIKLFADDDDYKSKKRSIKCRGNTPACLTRFLRTRENQGQCLRCISYKGKLYKHPKIQLKKSYPQKD